MGRLVSFESRLDRWRPARLTERLWKENPEAGGGTLLDLGPHLVDQALVLFGKPEAVSAEVVREKDGPGANDSFTIRLRYPGLLGDARRQQPFACLPGRASTCAEPRAATVKYGVDPQEAALNKITRIDLTGSGMGPGDRDQLGHAARGYRWRIGKPSRSRAAGDYRLFYAGIRDALLGKAAPPVTGVDAWRVARAARMGAESSEKRREIACDWSEEPE